MKLVTWNTQWCCGNDGIVSPQRIVDGARALEPGFDVLCLQEISVNYPRLPGNPGHDQLAILRGLLPGFQLFFGAAVDEFEGGERRQFGNLIATRLPVAQVQHHPLPWPADAGVRSMPRMCTVVTVHDPALGLVRIMTTHLEFYSKVQRMAQALALRELHAAACAQALSPPEPSDDGSAFQSKPHTTEAILCGDFNLEPSEAEYTAIQEPFVPAVHAGREQSAINSGAMRFTDSWTLLHGTAPRPPTFRLHDRRYGPEPVACDFAFVSDGLQNRVRSLRVDGATQASDHQPVALELG
ncbi:MAG: endonuclease/exonuclease/phosphatase family protein [Ramlibacter sp.]